MRIIFLIVFICSFTSSFGQNTRQEKLKVFLDCKNAACDNNYIRTEITLVDFVLDRIAADVHILITGTQSGNGGSRIQYIFYGQNNFKNFTDSLTSNINPNATEVEIRTVVVRRIKLGLIPFLSHSSFSHLIDINMNAVKSSSEEETGMNSETTDQWDYWIFNVGSDGAFSADQVYKSNQISGNISANRTTDKLKINFNTYGAYNSTAYIYKSDSSTLRNIVINSNYSLYHNLVKSIDNHWSVGYEISHNNNTFSNIKSQQYFRPAIEYAIFPYSEVNNKFFTINYGIDVRHNRYYEITIYDKISETLWGHRAQAYLSLRQKWGNVNSSLTYSNYLNNWRFNNLALSVKVDVRVTGGLSFYVYSNAGLIRDQVYLVKGEASEQDILVRRRQLASEYNFYSGIGLNYRFGSIFNNFVNPRFDQP